MVVWFGRQRSGDSFGKWLGDARRARCLSRGGLDGALIVVTTGLVLAASGLDFSLAMEAASPAGEDASEPPRPPKGNEHRKRAKAVRKPEAAPSATPAAMPPPPAALAPAPVANVFDAQLVKAGATTCAPALTQLASATMGGVATVGTASNWYTQAPDRRPASLLLGQKFGAAGVTNAAAAVIAAPQPDGKCDAFSVQVVPSPQSCAQLRDALAKNGRQIADLSGVALMQDASAQTMLVPAGSGCVLVGIRSQYAK